MRTRTSRGPGSASSGAPRGGADRHAAGPLRRPAASRTLPSFSGSSEPARRRRSAEQGLPGRPAVDQRQPGPRSPRRLGGSRRLRRRARQRRSAASASKTDRYGDGDALRCDGREPRVKVADVVVADALLHARHQLRTRPVRRRQARGRSSSSASVAAALASVAAVRRRASLRRGRAARCDRRPRCARHSR